MPSDPEPLPAAKQLEILRDTKRSTPIHPMERRLLWLLSVHLCFVAWALGNTRGWSQIVSLALSVAGMWLALAPREIRVEEGTAVANLWPRLLRFPLFWLGGALLVYVFVQGLNYSWVFQGNKVFWLLRSAPNVGWLPTSVRAPFFRFNVWRQFIIYADAWLLVCTVWVGLTRRRSIRILLTVLVINALALSAFLVWERVEGAIRVSSTAEGVTSLELTSSFTNRNLAGEYFSLMVFSVVALATWYFEYGRRRLLKSTPAGVLALEGALLVGVVFFTLSRGAALSCGLSLVFFALWIALRRIRRPAAPDSNPALTASVGIVFITFAAISIHYLDFSEILDRFNALATQQANEVSVSSRVLARGAAVDMLQDCGLRGVGAGSFRYLFVNYIKNYPAIYDGGRQFWAHAHCDWLEIPIELGLAGSLLLLAGAAWGAQWFIRRKFVWHPLAVPLLLGCFATLMHAGFDFPFSVPGDTGDLGCADCDRGEMGGFGDEDEAGRGQARQPPTKMRRGCPSPVGDEGFGHRGQVFSGELDHLLSGNSEVGALAEPPLVFRVGK